MSPIEVITKNMVTISYMGKSVKKELVVPGLVKAGNAYLVQCSVTGDWSYCNEERLAKLTAKFGTIEDVGTKYVGRDGKAVLKKAAALMVPDDFQPVVVAGVPAVDEDGEVVAEATEEV